jgi:zinc protease
MKIRHTLFVWVALLFFGFHSLPLYSMEPLGSRAAAAPPTVIQATDTRTLLNGLRIEILNMPQSPLVALHLLIGAGSALDPQGKAGMAELTMATLIESVPDWQGDPLEITKVLEAGKKFHYQVDWDTTHLFAECQPDEVNVYLQALTRFVRYATLSPARFEKVRNDFLKAAAEGKHTPRQWAERSFESHLFRGNPYARPLKGTVDTFKNIVFGDTVGFQKKYHLPNVSYLSLVGPVQADEVRRLAGRALGIWIMDRAFPYTFTPPLPGKGL